MGCQMARENRFDPSFGKRAEESKKRRRASVSGFARGNLPSDERLSQWLKAEGEPRARAVSTLAALDPANGGHDEGSCVFSVEVDAGSNVYFGNPLRTTKPAMDLPKSCAAALLSGSLDCVTVFGRAIQAGVVSPPWGDGDFDGNAAGLERMFLAGPGDCGKKMPGDSMGVMVSLLSLWQAPPMVVSAVMDAWVSWGGNGGDEALALVWALRKGGGRRDAEPWIAMVVEGGKGEGGIGEALALADVVCSVGPEATGLGTLYPSTVGWFSRMVVENRVEAVRAALVAGYPITGTGASASVFRSLFHRPQTDHLDEALESGSLECALALVGFGAKEGGDLAVLRGMGALIMARSGMGGSFVLNMASDFGFAGTSWDKEARGVFLTPPKAPLMADARASVGKAAKQALSDEALMERVSGGDCPKTLALLEKRGLEDVLSSLAGGSKKTRASV